MTKNDNYFTASKNNDPVIPAKKYVAGDSVDKHSDLEEANIILTGDEIHQQNENL
ncbi:hypothetical protein QE429_002315 [Bacillus sp. SORGH_AS 510]|uniref:hypothetical protein n=1 Tax=Bacillus sp. SORGH_AS_0510 TaxID=3041771 RepID=UPI002789D5AD|nr:hypothetical protein [Bacillus sp. SORGH_AS_0510]MDQ1145488.1 hypothetical protein [Bacillus sp. SORGH_AS_0510]